MGSRLAHRLVGFRRREDSRLARDRGAGERARVSRAIEPLTVLHDNARNRSERPRLAEHSFGDVRLEPNALPLAGAERATLVPDRVGNSEPAEAVHQTRLTQGIDRVSAHSRTRRGLGRQVGDRLRMTEKVRRLQVDEIRYRAESGVKAFT